MQPTPKQLANWNKIQTESRMRYALKRSQKPKIAPSTRVRAKKDKGLAWYIKKSISEAKRVVRKLGYCERCGSTKELQGSHIIPLSSSRLLGATLNNILCLCMSCHLYWWHKHPLAASEWFNEKWPGRKRELEKHATELRNNKPTLQDWKNTYERLKRL